MQAARRVAFALSCKQRFSLKIRRGRDDGVERGGVPVYVVLMYKGVAGNASVEYERGTVQKAAETLWRRSLTSDFLISATKVLRPGPLQVTDLSPAHVEDVAAANAARRSRFRPDVYSSGRRTGVCA